MLSRIPRLGFPPRKSRGAQVRAPTTAGTKEAKLIEKRREKGDNKETRRRSFWAARLTTGIRPSSRKTMLMSPTDAAAAHRIDSFQKLVLFGAGGNVLSVPAAHHRHLNFYEVAY